MKDLLFRGGVGLGASLAATMVYLLSAELAIALSIALAIVLVAGAFVVKPVVLVSGASNGVVALVLALVALVVLLARSAAVDASSR